MRYVWLAIALTACATTPPKPQASTTPTKSAALQRSAPPWIVDDWPRARTEAARANKPIFVDAWATWCHTCKSMRAFVLDDPALASWHDKFVWLAIDVEREASADFVAKFPVGSLPAFFVIEPQSSGLVGRHLGALSLAELRVFLDEGERAALGTRGDLDADTQLLIHAHANGALPRKRIDELRQLLARVPANWPRRLEAVIAELDALDRTHSDKDTEECVVVGARELPLARAQPSAMASDFVSYVEDCLSRLPKTDPRIVPTRTALRDHLLALYADEHAPISIDDRADALLSIAELDSAMGDAAAAKHAHEQRRDLLDKTVAALPDLEAQTTFDWARAESWLALGQGDRALALFTERERQRPDDYNPPYRLGRIHLELGHYADALAACDRAIQKAYGPRKAQMLGLRADALAKLGRTVDARAAADAALQFIESLPLSQQRPRDHAAAEARIKRLQTATEPSK